MTWPATPISNPTSFWEEARWQQVCAVCETGGDFQAHHVVPKPILKRLREPLYDTRGALRLCEHCHMQFEWAGPGKVLVTPLHWTIENHCYVWEVLGVTAIQLERKYGPLSVDPRWEMHLEGTCELCQKPRIS